MFPNADNSVPHRDLHREWTPNEIDFVEAIASNPDIYVVANQFPTHKHDDGGRPAAHPPVVYLVYITLAGVVGSHRKAASIIANAHYWSIIKTAAHHVAGVDLASGPPTRNMCEYNRKRIATQVYALAEAFRTMALSQAREHCLLDPHTPRSTTEPKRANFVAADGKVAKCPISEEVAMRWRATGRSVDASNHKQGGEPEPVFGAKFWLATTRADNRRNDRIILDVRPVTSSDGGEAAIATTALETLAHRAPGLHGVCYDGAFRGTHINRLLKRGITVLCPTHRGSKATPVSKVRCGCGETHELWTRRGELCEQHILDTGETHLASSPVAKKYSRRNANGTFRWYIDIALSCGTIHTERLDTTREDKQRRYNRTEHLRQHIKDGTDGVYRRCYGWREDAESVNDLIQQTFYKGRMIAYTAARQYLVMLGFAIGRNSLARWLRQQRPQPCT